MLWKRDAEFREIVKNCKGFCFQHFIQLYELSGQHLKGDMLLEFRQLISSLQTENLKRVEDDLEWFTLKFDYRYKEQPWKNAKDALARSILKINSQWADKSTKK